MRNLILGLSLSVAFIVGCLVRPLVVPPVRAGTNPPKWEYKCFRETGESKVEAKSNKLGAAGFEMTGSAGGVGGEGWGSSQWYVWCFKRRLP